MKPFGNEPAAKGKAGRKKENAAGPTAAKGSGFQPLGQALQRSVETEGKGSFALAGGHEKKVETVEEEGVVKKIVVRCSCGEVTEIDCRYGD
jgi:hypothetical protein